MRLDDLKVDIVKQEEGDWVDNIPDLEGVRLKVRGINNLDFQKLQRKLIAAVPRRRRVSGPGGTLEPAEVDRITNQCLIATVLLDWDGITQQNGAEGESPLPYSKELGHKILADPAHKPFRDGLIWAATIVTELDRDTKDEAVKN